MTPPPPACTATSPAVCVGASGAVVSGTAGASVNIPSGALGSDVAVSLAVGAGTSPSLPVGTSAASLVWQLLPHGTVFAKAVTVTLPFDPAAVATGVSPHLYKAQPGGSYTEVTPITISGSFVSAQVSSFSYFVLTANKLPVALLTMPTGSAITGQALSFSANGSSDAEGALASYRWDFGDGSAVQEGASLASVTHAYASAGTYQVSLTVTDALGAASTAAATLGVTLAPPVCVAPQVLSGGVCVTPPPVCTPPQVLTSGVCVTPPPVCVAPQVLSGSVCITPNQAPGASVTANITTLVTGQEVLLDPSASSDPDGRIVSYEWAMTEASPVTTTTPAVQSMRWGTPGSKSVSLKVTDNQGASNTYTLGITVTSIAPTGVLNDTGIDWCSEIITTPGTWVNNAVCSVVNWVGNLWGQQQDAYSGRDAQAKAGTLSKVGGGLAGFDFTKLGSDGRPLVNQGAAWSDTGSEAAGTRWDCVRDNTTGLTWEVKRNDATHLRHMGHSYGWYNTDATNNGGAAGYPNNADTGATCTGVADSTKCNTQSFATAVNALPTGQALCGFRDWRMPSVEELAGLAHLGRNSPAIDGNYFPNTPSSWYWSASPIAGAPDFAWSVYFSYGIGDNSIKNYAYQVRLVRSGQ